MIARGTADAPSWGVRLLGLSLAVCAACAAGCYEYAPPRAVDAPLRVAPLPNPDAIAVAAKPAPKAPDRFTFVGGDGNELTVDQLEARYVRAVGHDDVADAFRRNKVTAVASGLGFGVAWTVLGAWAIAQCAASPGSCPGATQGKIALAELTGVGVIVAAAIETTRSPHDLALLTKGQARDLVARYDRELARHASDGPPLNPSAAPR